MAWGRIQAGNVPNAEEAEVTERIQRVALARQRAFAQGRELTYADLDRILPEDINRRTYDPHRPRRGPYHRSSR